MKTKFGIVSIVLLFAITAKAQHSVPVNPMTNFAFPIQEAMQLNPFAPKKDVQGSKFLYPDWVGGKAVNLAGAEFSGKALFNFDKISQNLYVQLKDTTKDVAFLVDKWQLKAIYLSDGNSTYNLEKNPSLDTNFFYRALVKGNKYSLYSRIKTTFIPADYTSNGIISSGNMYDEYKDEYQYFIIFPDRSAHEISLKKKAIKSVLRNEKEKADKFFTENSSGEVNEKLLIKLLEALNE